MKTLSASATVTINAIATKKKMNGESEEDIYQALHVLKQAINRLVGETS